MLQKYNVSKLNRWQNIVYKSLENNFKTILKPLKKKKTKNPSYVHSTKKQKGFTRSCEIFSLAIFHDDRLHWSVIWAFRKIIQRLQQLQLTMTLTRCYSINLKIKH